MISNLVRLAAALILVSQVLLLRAVFDPSGTTAIQFAFGGHPAISAGIAVAVVALTLRIRSTPPR